MSIRLSVRLKLKISVTTEPIGFYSSGNISTGSVVVLSYFLGGCDTSNPSIKNKIIPLHFLRQLIIFRHAIKILVVTPPMLF